MWKLAVTGCAKTRCAHLWRLYMPSDAWCTSSQEGRKCPEPARAQLFGGASVPPVRSTAPRRESGPPVPRGGPAHLQWPPALARPRGGAGRRTAGRLARARCSARHAPPLTCVQDVRESPPLHALHCEQAQHPRSPAPRCPPVATRAPALPNTAPVSVCARNSPASYLSPRNL